MNAKEIYADLWRCVSWRLPWVVLHLPRLSSKWLVRPCCTLAFGSRRCNPRLPATLPAFHWKQRWRTPLQCHSWHHTEATKSSFSIGVMCTTCVLQLHPQLLAVPRNTFLRLNAGHHKRNLPNTTRSCCWLAQSSSMGSRSSILTVHALQELQGLSACHCLLVHLGEVQTNKQAFFHQSHAHLFNVHEAHISAT